MSIHHYAGVYKRTGKTLADQLREMEQRLMLGEGDCMSLYVAAMQARQRRDAFYIIVGAASILVLASHVSAVVHDSPWTIGAAVLSTMLLAWAAFKSAKLTFLLGDFDEWTGRVQ